MFPWNKGRTDLKNTWQLGIPRTEEVKQRISKANKGKKRTEEHKRNIASGHTGEKHYLWGKHHTAETKKKMSRARLGKTWSKEVKLKLSLAHKKDKNPQWKGGVTSLRMQITNLFQYRQWRSDVFTRDDFTCQKCGKRGGELHAHHIQSFGDIVLLNDIKTVKEALECSELWNINNGLTLCKSPCHKEEHKKITHNYVIKKYEEG